MFKPTIYALFILFMGMYLNAKTYKGGELRTLTSYQYGKFEVRMKSAAGSGLLSSFFTYNDGTNLPANWNEVDIEILGQYNDQVQFNVISQGQVDHVYNQIVQYNPHDAFHVYAIEWTPDYVAWFVDGFEIFRQTGDHIINLFFTQKLMMNIWPPDYPGWVGTFDPVILPVFAYYDWVKYYSYTPGDNDNFTLQWTDDFNSWNQSRWEKASHTFWGNNCDFIPANVVFYNGYMILCLTTSTNTGYNNNPVVDIDNDPPYLVWARSYGNYVKLFFSEVLDSLSAVTTSNYTIPGIGIDQAQLLNDERSVILTTDNLDTALNYNLIVTGISDTAQVPNTMGLSFTVIANPISLPANINIAGDAWQTFIGDLEWDYSQEYGYVGGEVQRHDPSIQISGTTETEIYQSELRGLTFYNVRLANGSYRITLLMAETEFSSTGSRVFDVYIEDQLVVDGMDIYSQVGMNTALETVINNVQVSDEVLEFYFEDIQGNAVISGIKIEQISTAIGELPEVPKIFNWQIYPNPFNSTTTIEYQLEKSGKVELNMYNVLGQKVAVTLNSYQSSGKHLYRFNATDLTSGIYFIEINIDNNFKKIKKVVLME